MLGNIATFNYRTKLKISLNKYQLLIFLKGNELFYVWNSCCLNIQIFKKKPFEIAASFNIFIREFKEYKV